MRIGVPKEIKAEEKRVAITPSGVAALTAQGHQVWVERGAGLGSGITDQDFRRAGARIAAAREVWGRAEMVMKVKEPLASEYRYLRRDLILFTYLHLASSRPLTRALMRSGCTAVAYETIQLEDGSLPLLAPMSEIAGRLAVQVGAWCLEAQNGGSGVLLSGASGVRPGKVVVLGAGIAGTNSCQIAIGMGAQVSVIERNPNRLRYLHDVLGGHLTTLMSNRANIEEEVRGADLVIGTVLIAGAKAPRLVTRRMVRSMRPGSAIVDVSLDQGGCVETARPTSHRKPIYIEERVVHYAVTNMPGIVPHTSTYALTNATLQYALSLANRGLRRAVHDDPALARGVNVMHGKITHEAVADAFRLPHAPLRVAEAH
ncbi:MAG: alanine dehydrogenase [Deltaproteobacteria bacterium]|nr:alanine dehydrogenase [Deltaproteobacteria bacterium]